MGYNDFKDILKVFEVFNEKKEVSAMDNGFIASCIEEGELDLARQFLMNIYKMTLQDAIIHVGKVMQKKVPIE